jgi:hypothetical protein
LIILDEKSFKNPDKRENIINIPSSNKRKTNIDLKNMRLSKSYFKRISGDSDIDEFLDRKILPKTIIDLTQSVKI